MSNVAIAFIVFCSLFGAAVLGMRLHSALPEHHLKDESKDLLKLALGIIGTMSGLVLGLLVASASGAYNAQRSNVIDWAAKIALLDRVLAHFGPESDPARESLRDASSQIIGLMWPNDRERPASGESRNAADVLFERLEALNPKTDEQKSIKTMALGLALDLGKLRWQMYEQLSSTISVPLLVLLVLWFSTIFMGFGVLSTRNATTLVAMALCAVSITAAVYLMLEMYAPFQGLLQISNAPIKAAFAQLGK
jgi:hypothetical protein